MAVVVLLMVVVVGLRLFVAVVVAVRGVQLPLFLFCDDGGIVHVKRIPHIAVPPHNGHHHRRRIASLRARDEHGNSSSRDGGEAAAIAAGPPATHDTSVTTRFGSLCDRAGYSSSAGGVVVAENNTQQVLMFVCVRSDRSSTSETLCSLEFASRAKVRRRSGARARAMLLFVVSSVLLFRFAPAERTAARRIDRGGGRAGGWTAHARIVIVVRGPRARD